MGARRARRARRSQKRHIKSTYASATPATDGRIVVAWFGSQGIYAYDVDGRFLWKVDIGRIDLGAYDIPAIEWGPASSPITLERPRHRPVRHARRFVRARARCQTRATRSGRPPREELPSWGTPTVATTSAGPELVTNASKFVRGYDPAHGQGTVANRRQLQDHRADADLRRRSSRRRQRTRARAADLRRQGGRARRSHAAGRPDQQ